MTNNHKYLLEICCYSAQDVLKASSAGAHRVELCNGYEVGGTTPSMGSLKLAKSNSNIPIYVMIRPRGGNFYYSSLEKKVILKDIELALLNEADGIVFGALQANGNIDKVFCKEVFSLCQKTPITFHRAIDICHNHLQALDFLTHHDVENILTSGMAVKAIDGIQNIKNMHLFANNGINIMAGSGITDLNIIEFAKIGLTHFHSSASEIVKGNGTKDIINFNASLNNDELSVVSEKKVSAMLQKLNAYFAPHA